MRVAQNSEAGQKIPIKRHFFKKKLTAKIILNEIGEKMETFPSG